MKIIHLISDISRINYGVWNVVVATFPFLIEQGHEPEIWFPSGGAPVPDEIKRFKFREIVSTEVGGQRSEDGNWKMEARSSKQEAGGSKLEAGSSKMEARSSKQEAGGSKGETGSWKLEDGKHARDKSIQEFQSSIPDPQSSILVSHGNWGWATKTGYKMKRAGYKWIAVPHGMLEPWSLRQKWLKKKLYFHLSEYPKLKKADAIIAVGRPEFNNLKKYFDKVYHIPNGIVPVETMNNPGEEEMGRWGEQLTNLLCQGQG